MKKSYKCEKLEKTIHFLPSRVAFCCSNAQGASTEELNFSHIDFNNIEQKRKSFIQALKQGIIPKECTGCCDYKETEPQSLLQKIFPAKDNNKIKIQHIIIDHYKQCECNCIYCSGKLLYPNTTQNYEILPIIKELYKRNCIDRENLLVEFQGGNLSLLKEFKALMEEFNKENATRYIFLTNNIKYVEEIEQYGNQPESIISISLDAGTRETYKRIKGVDAFDIVVENIQKYRQNTQLLIFLKYIILEGENDNLEELKHFLEIAKEVNTNGEVSLEIDYRKMFMNNPEEFKIPQIYYDMFNLAEEFCKNNNLPYKCNDYHKLVLEKGTNKIN